MSTIKMNSVGKLIQTKSKAYIGEQNVCFSNEDIFGFYCFKKVTYYDNQKFQFTWDIE
jgi:hypothetical protein